MYTYTRELAVGYLVMRPNLEKLLTALAGWRSTYTPGTLVAGRSTGKYFARLAQINVSALLARTQPGETLYLIGNKDTVTYVRLIKLEDEEVVVVDTFPSIVQFEYDESLKLPDKRLTEGIVLSGVQVVIPFTLLTKKQLSSILLAAKQYFPDLERVQSEKAYITSDISISVELQEDVTPPQTVFTMRNIGKLLIWTLIEKSALYNISSHFERIVKEI